VVNVDPWPFDVMTIDLQIRCRRIPGGRFDSVEQFRERYGKTDQEILRVQFKV
jgi:hypothetical protein